MKTQIAAYYFPNYHPDPRNAIVHGPGWTEWELVKKARPRFAGHRQPRVPLWGCENEADPVVMRRKIDTAQEFGLDAFVFDWYCYEDGLFLEQALEKGFMPVVAGTDFKFALMWANHDWTDIHPWRVGTLKPVLYHGVISDAAFDRMTDYVIEKYFRHPNYWKIDGKPYFSIYNLPGLGAPERLTKFRNKAAKAGFPGIHINMILQEEAILPGENGNADAEELIDARYFDSVTSYIWLHHCRLEHFPVTPYRKVMDAYLEFYRKTRTQYCLPCYPNVTVGWDSSPRTDQSTPFEEYGYPYTPVMTATPGEFGDAMRTFLADAPELLFINAWNEWTEGSYLEPDLENGTAYLWELKDSRLIDMKIQENTNR